MAEGAFVDEFILMRSLLAMKRWIAILTLVVSTCGLSGCGKSDQPKTDAEGKAVKAPDVPPNGV
jgi:hypothetical protein